MYQMCKHGKQDGEPCEACSEIVKKEFDEKDKKLRFSLHQQLSDFQWEHCDHDTAPHREGQCCKWCALDFVRHKIGGG